MAPLYVFRVPLGFAVIATVPSEAGSPCSLVLGTRRARTLGGGTA